MKALGERVAASAWAGTGHEAVAGCCLLVHGRRVVGATLARLRRLGLRMAWRQLFEVPPAALALWSSVLQPPVEPTSALVERGALLELPVAAMGEPAARPGVQRLPWGPASQP